MPASATNRPDEDEPATATAVVPPPRTAPHALSAVIDLAPGPEGASSARRLVATVLQDWHLTDEDWHAEIALVVSELVGNAVRHSGGNVQLGLELGSADLTITVSDGSEERPQRREADLMAESGRGIAIIEALTEAWGTQVSDGGKLVWARVRLPH